MIYSRTNASMIYVATKKKVKTYMDEVTVSSMKQKYWFPVSSVQNQNQQLSSQSAAI